MADIWGCFVFFQRWSVRCGRKRRPGRGAGKQGLLYSRLLGSVATGQRSPTRREPHGGSTQQVGSHESGEPAAGGQGEVYKEKHEGMSWVCAAVTVSQSGKGKKGKER